MKRIVSFIAFAAYQARLEAAFLADWLAAIETSVLISGPGGVLTCPSAPPGAGARAGPSLAEVSPAAKAAGVGGGQSLPERNVALLRSAAAAAAGRSAVAVAAARHGRPLQSVSPHVVSWPPEDGVPALGPLRASTPPLHSSDGTEDDTAAVETAGGAAVLASEWRRPPMLSALSMSQVSPGPELGTGAINIAQVTKHANLMHASAGHSSACLMYCYPRVVPACDLLTVGCRCRSPHRPRRMRCDTHSPPASSA